MNWEGPLFNGWGDSFVGGGHPMGESSQTESVKKVLIVQPLYHSTTTTPSMIHHFVKN